MIRVENLGYTFPIDFKVFENVSFEIEKGEFWGILGSNGSGKSTLVEVLLGMKKKQAGSIYFEGNSVDNLLLENRSRVAYISQDIFLKNNMSVKEFLNFHAHFYPNYSSEFQQELLDYFELKLQTKLGSLSTGQKNKVQAVAGLAANTDLIIVDEVTAVLDPKSRHRFFAKLVEYNKVHGKTIMLATNIVEDLIGRVEHILFMSENKCLVHRHATIEKLFE